MKIPLYHKVEKERSGSIGERKPIDVKSASSHKNAIFEVENSIEIQFNSNHFRTYHIPFMLLSWLLMLLTLLVVHNTVRHHIESQRVEVALLKEEVKFLSAEVLLLKSQSASMNAPTTEEISLTPEDEVVSDEKPVALQEQTMYTIDRKKRDTGEEMTNDFKGLAATERKIANINAGRGGKQSSKKCKRVLGQRRRQCNRCLSHNSSKCSGFQAIHLKGAHPETVVEAGHVGPWFIDNKSVKDSRISSSFQLREDGESVEIESAGLYFIYAQVYYLTSHALNSFTIKLVPKDSENPVSLALCSSNTVSASSTSEVSCFTATMHTLQAGDRIYVQQREKNRRLIMRSGYSFLGLMKFSAH